MAEEQQPAQALTSEEVQSTEELTLEEPKPLQPKPKSNLDLVNECDSFPYSHVDPQAYRAHIDTYYKLQIAEEGGITLGFVLPSVAEIFRGLSDWNIDDDERVLLLTTGATEAERSAVVATNTEAMRQLDHFKVLKGWRNELYPVYGQDNKLLFSIERAASALFGVVTYGCHMTAYTVTEDKTIKIWVPRRAYNKQTYGGMLDNTVAGGLATGESPLDCIVREAAEEASLPEDLVRKQAKAVGAVTYFHIRDERAGGETGLLQPECQYVYDLELPSDVVPKPGDAEVHEFQLMTVESVQEALQSREFKPNCALVMLDFFVRHGILTPADNSYLEIVARLHRRLEFPTV